MSLNERNYMMWGFWHYKVTDCLGNQCENRLCVPDQFQLGHPICPLARVPASAWPGWASCPGLCHIPMCLPWPWAQMACWVYWFGLGKGWLPHLHLMMVGLSMEPICHHCPDVHSCHWEGDGPVSSLAALFPLALGTARPWIVPAIEVKLSLQFTFFIL